MFPIVELKATALDYGIPGVSPTLMLLLFGMMLALSMIPYAFLYASLREERGKASKALRVSHIPEFATRPFTKMIAWVHAHQHPHLLHH